jgi:hypothetical protein
MIAIQAKHWQPKPPVGRDVVEQLIRGIEAESAGSKMHPQAWGDCELASSTR